MRVSLSLSILMNIRRLILLSTLALAACSAEADQPPTAAAIPTAIPPAGLPTAIAPEQATGSWAVSFEYDFPENFWPIGQHEYGFFIDCPALGQIENAGDYRLFQVTNAASLFQNPIYFRLAGLSTGVLAPINVDVIHPEQATIAVVTIIGVTEEQASAAAEVESCQVVFGWDGQAAETLIAGEPFQP